MARNKENASPAEDVSAVGNQSSETDNGKAELKEIRPKRKKTNLWFIALYIVAFLFVLYASYTIISQHVEIVEKRTELEGYKEEIRIVEINNKELKEMKNYSGKELDEYIEKLAREELGYVKNGERIFVNVNGD